MPRRTSKKKSRPKTGERDWNKREIIRALRYLAERDGFVGTAAVLAYRPPGFKSLKLAIRAEYGSINKAKEIAGLQCWPLWTAERIRATIRKHFDRDHAVTHSALSALSVSMAQAADRVYGSWQRAVRVAGRTPSSSAPTTRRRPPKACKGWTRPSLVRYLQQFEKRHGFAGASRLDRVRVPGRMNPRMAARKLFGSLGAAKKAAGVGMWPLWTKERVKRELRSLARAGKLKSYYHLVQKYPRLAAGAHRCYGSVKRALRACEVHFASQGIRR